MEFLQILRRLLQVLTAIHRAYESWARERELDKLKLQINETVDELKMSTREQAQALYASLEGCDELLDSLGDVTDMDELGDWFADYNDWREATWAPISGVLGAGVSIMRQALEAHVLHRVLGRVAGVSGEIAADWTVSQLRAMAETDLEALQSGDSPIRELAINRFAAAFPRCKYQRALAYYETRPGYEQITDALLRVNTREELADWLLSFHEWREEAWGQFYEQPCGVTLGDMYYVESRTYLAALMHINGDDANQMFLELNVGLRDKERADRALIDAHRRA